MPAKLTDTLDDLSLAELRALVEEVGIVFPRERPPHSRADLVNGVASVLARPEVLTGLLGDMSQGQRALLGVLDLEGRALSLSRVAEIASSATDLDLLAEAALRLRAAGLARLRRPRPDPAAWIVDVPAAVRTHQRTRGIHFFRLQEVLPAYSDPILRAMARFAGHAGTLDRPACLRFLTQRLSDAKTVRALAAALDDDQEAIFDAVANRFSIEAGALARALTSGEERAPGTLLGMPLHEWILDEATAAARDHPPAVALLLSGLLGQVRSGYWVTMLTVPVEVRQALLGGRLLPAALMQRPRLEHADHPQGVPREHAALLPDLAMALAFLATDPITPRKDGSMAKRDLRRLAQRLALKDEAYAALCLDLLSHHQLAPGWRPAVDAAAWLSRPPAQVLADLWQGWRDLRFRRATGASDQEQVQGLRWMQQAVVKIVPFLRELPEAGPVTADSVGWLISYQQPEFWAQLRAKAEDALARLLTGEALWFGALRTWVDASGKVTAVQLTPRGRWLLEGAAGEASDLFPPLVEHAIVQANFDVVAPPNIRPDVLADLQRFATPVSSEGALVLRLSRESIRAALDAGLSADEILATLRRTSAQPLPATVERLVQECGAQHGQIEIGHAGWYLKVSNPMLLRELRANPRFRPYLADQDLVEGVALLTGDPRPLLKELRQRGYMPRHYAPPEPASARPPSATPRPSRYAAVDWDALAAAQPARKAATPSFTPPAPVPPSPGGSTGDAVVASPWAYSPDDVAAVLDAVLGRPCLLEMEYANSTGEIRAHQVTPLSPVEHGRFLAFCRRDDNAITFNLDQVRRLRILTAGKRSK